MNTIIIEPSTKLDYQLFIDLAKRLKVSFREEKTIKKGKNKEADFFALAGSFDLPETSNELIEIIESSRTSKKMDTSWSE